MTTIQINAPSVLLTDPGISHSVEAFEALGVTLGATCFSAVSMGAGGSLERLGAGPAVRKKLHDLM